MVLFLSGLAAVPPTVSFGGRFLLWEAVAVAGGGGWVWIGLANGLLTAGACARLGMVFLRPAASGTEPASDIASPLAAVVLLCAVLSLWGVLWPEGLLEALRVSG